MAQEMSVTKSFMNRVEQGQACYCTELRSQSLCNDETRFIFDLVDSVVGSPAFSNDVVPLHSGGRNRDAPSPSFP